MPNYIRPAATGAVVFFTVYLADRRKTLLTDHINKLRRAVREVRRDAPFGINAWVVLPDHMHAVWTLPSGDRAYGQRWGKVKSKFTRSLRDANVVSRHEMRHAKETLGHAGIWQPRFWEHHIRSEAALQTTIRHCWGNPVKHGYVDDPHDWPFSSIHRDVPRTGVSAA